MSVKIWATISGAMQAVGLLVGFSTMTLVTPMLIWITLAADLPLVMVILLLVCMAVISNCVSQLAVRLCTLDNASSHQPYGAPKSAPGTSPSQGDEVPTHADYAKRSGSCRQ